MPDTTHPPREPLQAAESTANGPPSAQVVDRRYVLTRIAAGDYLLPSNDGKTLWRIAKYTDGPSFGLDWPRDRQVWGYWKWTEPITAQATFDPDDWEKWDQWGSTYETRQAAINDALDD